MNKKTISLIERIKKDNIWKFPFSKDDIKRIRISIEPGLVRWYMPQDLFERLPDKIELYYTNIFGLFLIISTSVEDLDFLDRVFTGIKDDLYRFVYPYTDDSVTVKKRFGKKSQGLQMKVKYRNLALIDYMDRYSRTLTKPAIPKIVLGRFLVVRGRIRVGK